MEGRESSENRREEVMSTVFKCDVCHKEIDGDPWCHTKIAGASCRELEYGRDFEGPSGGHVWWVRVYARIVTGEGVNYCEGCARDIASARVKEFNEDLKIYRVLVGR